MQVPAQRWGVTHLDSAKQGFSPQKLDSVPTSQRSVSPCGDLWTRSACPERHALCPHRRSSLAGRWWWDVLPPWSRGFSCMPSGSNLRHNWEWGACETPHSRQASWTQPRKLGNGCQQTWLFRLMQRSRKLRKTCASEAYERNGSPVWMDQTREDHRKEGLVAEHALKDKWQKEAYRKN